MSSTKQWQKVGSYYFKEGQFRNRWPKQGPFRQSIAKYLSPPLSSAAHWRVSDWSFFTSHSLPKLPYHSPLLRFRYVTFSSVISSKSLLNLSSASAVQSVTLPSSSPSVSSQISPPNSQIHHPFGGDFIQFEQNLELFVWFSPLFYVIRSSFVSDCNPIDILILFDFDFSLKTLMKKVFQMPIFILLTLLELQRSSFASPTPLNCSDTTRLCTSFLALNPDPHHTLAEIQSMFDVLPTDVTVEDNSHGYLFIKKNCSCSSPSNKYLTNTTFTVRKEEGSVFKMVTEAYGGLALAPNWTRRARVGAVVSLHLACGCSSRLWNYLLSYVMNDGDTIESLASRFGVSMDSIETVNGIADPENVTVGAVYYIPLNSGRFLSFASVVFLLFWELPFDLGCILNKPQIPIILIFGRILWISTHLCMSVLKQDRIVIGVTWCEILDSISLTYLPKSIWTVGAELSINDLEGGK